MVLPRCFPRPTSSERHYDNPTDHQARGGGPLAQLCGLERRTARGGRDSIDHAPGGHDDLANAVAGAAALALGHQGVVVTRELLQRVAAMPATRKHTAWGFRRRAALASFLIPREQQCYPRSVLPASKFEQGGESR